MDNEALVDQIVRSLSFEVVAMPQSVLQIDSTSKSTPLNVKIRVRKKHDAVLRHGVLSMPKVDTKSHSGKDNPTQRVRLVSSDQTVMSFNVLMDAELDKIPTKCDKQKFNMVTPGVGINNDEDNPAALSKNTNKYNFSPSSKRNKDIFGRCKPGGCLDPPFGEDKYSYQPTKQDLSLPTKADANKLRSSSIFKNKIFQRKKKSFQDVVEFNETGPKTTTEDDSILSLYETGSNAAYSNSIITYPHPSSSGEITAAEEKPNRKRYVSDEKSRSSVSENAGSYYILPKKVRNKSNQSDFEITKPNDDKVQPDYNNVKSITTKIENYEKIVPVKDEVKQTANFIPIPLLVPLKVVSKDIFNTESNTPLRKEDLSVLDTETKSDESVSVVPKIRQLNCAIDETDFINKETTIDALKNTLLVAFKDIERIAVSELAVSQITQNFEDNTIDTVESRLSTTTENAESNTKKDDSDYLDLNHGDQMDIKSYPLVSVKERSILDITANYSSSQNVTETTKNVVEVSENKNTDTVLFSTDNLAHLWKNKNEPLKSMPDFITKDTLEGINNEEENKASSIEPQPLLLESSSYNTDFSQQDLELENDLVPLTAEILEDGMTQKENKTLDVAPVSQTYTKLFNPSDENEEKSLLENLDRILNTDNKTDDSSPALLNQKDLNEYLLNNEMLDQRYDRTEFFTQNNDDKCFSPVKKISNSEESTLLHEKSNAVTQNSLLNKQNNVVDVTHDNNETFDSSNILKNASMMEMTKDEIIEKDMYDLINEESKIGDEELEDECEKNKPVTGTLYRRDDIYCSSNNLDNIPNNEKLEVLFNENKIMTEHKMLSNKVQLKQPQHKINEDFDESNYEKMLPNINSESEHKIESIEMLQKKSDLWKIDIGLQSYTDENNERVIKSFNSQNTPERHLNDTLLVAQCYLKSQSNEIKIPIDKVNELSIQIRSNTVLNSSKDFKKDEVIDNQSNKKKKIKLNVTNEKGIAKDKNANKPEVNKLNKAISDDIRDALNRIYEQDLLPLQEIIKGLREEIDMLVAYQNKFKEKVQKLPLKTSRPLKFVYPGKKCPCIRKI